MQEDALQVLSRDTSHDSVRTYLFHALRGFHGSSEFLSSLCDDTKSILCRVCCGGGGADVDVIHGICIQRKVSREASNIMYFHTMDDGGAQRKNEVADMLLQDAGAIGISMGCVEVVAYLITKVSPISAFVRNGFVRQEKGKVMGPNWTWNHWFKLALVGVEKKATQKAAAPRRPIKREHEDEEEEEPEKHKKVSKQQPRQTNVVLVTKPPPFPVVNVDAVLAAVPITLRMYNEETDKRAWKDLVSRGCDYCESAIEFQDQTLATTYKIVCIDNTKSSENRHRHSNLVGVLALEKTGWLTFVAVDVGFRKCGLGALLLALAMEIARAEGNPDFALKPLTTKVAKFYEKYGFLPARIQKSAAHGKLVGVKPMVRPLCPEEIYLDKDWRTLLPEFRIGNNNETKKKATKRQT
eukprot:PhF_6_TR29115/c0_g1_i1/m.42484